MHRLFGITNDLSTKYILKVQSTSNGSEIMNISVKNLE